MIRGPPPLCFHPSQFRAVMERIQVVLTDPEKGITHAFPASKIDDLRFGDPSISINDSELHSPCKVDIIVSANASIINRDSMIGTEGGPGVMTGDCMEKSVLGPENSSVMPYDTCKRPPIPVQSPSSQRLAHAFLFRR